MIRPSDVYHSHTKQEVIDYCKERGLKIVDFRVPRVMEDHYELYLTADPYMSPCNGAPSMEKHNGMRLIITREADDAT